MNREIEERLQRMQVNIGLARAFLDEVEKEAGRLRQDFEPPPVVRDASPDLVQRYNEALAEDYVLVSETPNPLAIFGVRPLPGAGL